MNAYVSEWSYFFHNITANILMMDFNIIAIENDGTHTKSAFSFLSRVKVLILNV